MTATESGTSDLATIPEAEAGACGADSGRARECWGLCVVWCPSEPEKLGAFLPGSSEPRLFGRGAALASDAHLRAAAVFQRPGASVAAGTFSSPSLSRVQLRFWTRTARLHVENLGQREMTLNGVVLTKAELNVGDVLEVGSQVSFVCVTRPPQLAHRVAEVQPFGEPDAHGMVGESPSMWQVREQLRFVATRTGHVLIQGSTGTGKELAARAVHRMSNRAGALVARNAATIPESLLDSELFGSAKNYPNVGAPERKGLIGAADAGTLFLDEFGELPLGHQTHLLRVLDAGEYQRLGESAARRADFRLIAATNRSEEALREDVLARFAFRVRLPALSARVEDVPLLLRHQLLLMTDDDPELRARFITSQGHPRFSASFVRAAIRGAAHMDLRTMRNRLWTSLQHSSGDVLDWVEPRDARAEQELAAPEHQLSEPEIRRQLQAALDENQGSLEKTWRALGLANRFVLMRLMKKHDLQVERRVTGEPPTARAK